VAQAELREIGDGGVREHDLPRREAVGVAGGIGGAAETGGGAEEGDLEAPAARPGIEAAGEVPPLDTRVGMGTEVGGQMDGGGIFGRVGCNGIGCERRRHAGR
jgi:hypothetical protein